MAKVCEKLSRPPLERMTEFHDLIRSNKYPNCTTLAKKFGIHLRTVNRDLQFMRDRLELPLAYDSEKRGFYYTRPVDQFPMISITETEIFALLVAHSAIKQYQGTPFEQPLTRAFRKLSGQLDQHTEYGIGNPEELLSFRPLAPQIADTEVFEIVTRALKQRRVLKFQYRNLGARQAQGRTVHPYHLACIENHWYLFAFDVNRKAMRTFVLTRLADPEIVPGQFKVPKAFNPSDYLKGAFTVFKGAGDYRIVIRFDPWGTDLIRGRRWHPSQEFTELPDGCSQLAMRLDNLEEICGWVLSWGPHATAVEPAELVERIRANATAILESYAAAAHAPTSPQQVAPAAQRQLL